MNVERITQGVNDLSEAIERVNPDYRSAYLLGIRRGITWADSNPDWHQGSPEYNGNYIAVEKGNPDISEYYYKKRVWYRSEEDFFEELDGEEVTHPEIIAWMPFPVFKEV